jgi:hypothetical protein
VTMNPERRRRLVALGKLHQEWSADTEGSAAAAFTPRGPDSDYNQHHVDVDAPPAAEDEFHARARRIMGIPDPA